MQSSEHLEGQLLIATPRLNGSCFERSVIYVCTHAASGTMGIIINHVFGDLKCSDILGQLNITDTNLSFNSPIHFGGPVESSRGFILHTDDYKGEATTPLYDNLAMTSDIDAIKAITSGKGPRKSIIALGYAGWGEGQLEAEIMSNSWLTAPASESLIFDIDNHLKWNESAKVLGVNLHQYSSNIGHA